MKYGTESSSNKKFFTLFDGNIVTREPEGTEGATQRETKNGKTVWELTHNYIEGNITGGGIVVKEFDGRKVPEIQVELDEEGLLQIPMYLLGSIAEVLPILDRTEPVKFRTYKTKKDKVVLELSQGGSKLKSHFTEWTQGDDGKWTPTYKNNLPAPEYDEIDGWDFRDHDRFLKKVVAEFFADYVAPERHVSDEVPEGFEPAEDDVPF